MEKMRLFSIVFGLTLLSATISMAVTNVYRTWPGRILGLRHERDYLFMENSPVGALVIEKTINLGNRRQLAHVYHLTESVSGLAIVDYQNNFIEWVQEGTPTIENDDFRKPGEYLEWFRFDQLDNHYVDRELLVQYGNTGTAGVHPFYLYSYDGKDFRLLLKLVEASNQTEIRDLDGDDIGEIIHSYSLSGIGKLERDLLRWKDIWRLENGKPIKVNHQFPEEYQELIDLHQLALTKKEWEPDVKSYYPTLRCLKEKAELTTQGRAADTEECQELLRKRYE